MTDSVSEKDLKRTRRKRKPSDTSKPVVDRLPPHDLEAEKGALACILAYSHLARQSVELYSERFNGRTDVFYDLRHQTIIDGCMALNRAGDAIDTITLSGWLKDEGHLEQIGGIHYLSELANSAFSAENLSHYLDRIDDKYRLRKIIHTCTDIVGRVYDYEGDLDTLCDEVQRDFTRVFETPHVEVGDSATWRDLLEFDTGNDANNIIGVKNGKTTRYLCKGHGAWLIGPSGVGKSALMFQMGISFAGNLSFSGITPQRALRILIVQAENDKGDLAEMAKGIESGLKVGEFDNPDAYDQISKNIRVRSVTGKIGQVFCSWLRKEILDFHADLVLVDPLLSFAGIEVSRQDQVSQFCRLWLDPVLRETGAALISVHHTGKPPQSRKGEAPPTLYDMAYSGIGSSELVNWARAIMLLQPAGDNAFRLVLAKRGKRAWAQHPNGSYTQTVWLRHAANGSIFWEQTDPPEEQEETKPQKEKKLTIPEQIASLNLGTFLSQCNSQGETLRGLIKRLLSWLASKDCPKKSLATTSHGSMVKAVGLLLDNRKLSFSDDLYFKGDNA